MQFSSIELGLRRYPITEREKQPNWIYVPVCWKVDLAEKCSPHFRELENGRA